MTAPTPIPERQIVAALPAQGWQARWRQQATYPGGTTHTHFATTPVVGWIVFSDGDVEPLACEPGRNEAASVYDSDIFDSLISPEEA